MTWTETAKGQQTADVQSITSSTDATPIVITITSHGYSNGDVVHVMDHATNTNANGRWVVANQTANTFELTGSTSTGGGAGGATGTVSKEFQLQDLTTPGGKAYQLRINMENVVDGEWGEFFVYTKVHGTSGAVAMYDSQLFAHAPGDGPSVHTSIWVVGLNNIQFAIVQKAGTARVFDWDVIEQ